MFSNAHRLFKVFVVHTFMLCFDSQVGAGGINWSQRLARKARTWKRRAKLAAYGPVSDNACSRLPCDPLCNYSDLLAGSVAQFCDLMILWSHRCRGHTDTAQSETSEGALETIQ